MISSASPGRHLQRMQVQLQRLGAVLGGIGDARGEDIGARQLRLMHARLAHQRAGARSLALQQRLVGELAQVVRRHLRPLDLHVLRQLVEDLQRLGPVALRLVDAHQVIERRAAVRGRGRQLLEHPLGAVHEAGALVIQRQLEGRPVAQVAPAVVAQPRVDGDRPVDLAAAAKEAAERELDLGRIPVRLRHAREDLGGVVEAIVDEVIEALEVVARQAHGARGAVAAPEEIGGEADQHEGQRQEHRRYFEHAPRG